MSIERLPTPIDDLTGVPLLIAPPIEDNEWLAAEGPTEHHSYHPRLSPELTLSLGGRALRNSRMQLTTSPQHNFGQGCYHRYYDGPPLPDADDSAAQIRQVILNISGYLPHKIIDLSSGEPVIRDTKTEERQQLTSQAHDYSINHKELRAYCRLTGLPPNKAWRQMNMRKQARASMAYATIRYSDTPIRDFFEDYLLRPEMIDIKKRTIKRYLSTKDAELLSYMGDSILSRAVQVATAPLLAEYQNMFSLGAINQNIGPKPAKIMKFHLGSHRRRRKVILPKLSELLEQMAENAA